MPRKKERPPRGGLSERQALFNIRLRKDRSSASDSRQSRGRKAKRIIAQVEASGTIAVTEIVPSQDSLDAVSKTYLVPVHFCGILAFGEDHWIKIREQPDGGRVGEKDRHGN
jgi:hypothetical protein